MMALPSVSIPSVSPADAPETLLPLAAVQARIGDISRATVWRLARAGRLPRPCRIGSRALWSSREIDQWIADRLAERDRG